MWREAFIVALVTGGWTFFTEVPIQIATILSKKESKFGAWVIMILKGISDTGYYSPVFGAALTGLLLGDLQTGLLVGGTVQLMFIGVFIVGASVPPNPKLAAILTTAFSILTGASVGETLALVIPVSIVSQLLSLALLSVNVIFLHWADKMAEEGNTKGLDLLNTLNGMGWNIVDAIPAFLAVGLGVDFVATFLDKFPGWLAGGLGYAGGVLPALGVGMLLLIIASADIWPFFFLGFIAAVYMELNAVSGAILGLVIALIYVSVKPSSTAKATGKGK